MVYNLATIPIDQTTVMDKESLIVDQLLSGIPGAHALESLQNAILLELYYLSCTYTTNDTNLAPPSTRASPSSPTLVSTGTGNPFSWSSQHRQTSPFLALPLKPDWARRVCVTVGTCLNHRPCRSLPPPLLTASQGAFQILDSPTSLLLKSSKG